MKTRVILAACAFLTFAATAAAQEQPPALKPTPSTPGKQTTPPLALEIFYNSTLAPAYLKIDGADVKSHWIWFTRFSTLPGWQLPAGSQRINAVRVTSQWNGETADVRVTLLRGPNFYDDEEAVASYQTGLDEPTFITKLESHGIQPFKITLVSPKTVAPPSPNLENRTTSVEIVKLENEGLPLPSFRTTFRNLSPKNVAALRVQVFRDGGQPGPTVLFQGEDGRALIQSNGLLEKRISAHVPLKNGESYSPGVAAANSLLVSTAVFTDGTFEGDLGSACQYEAFVFGRRAWLKSVTKILNEPLTQGDDSQNAQQLRAKIIALRFFRTPAESVLTSAVSSECPPPARITESTFSAENLKLIRDLDVVTNTRPKPLVSFRAWLESTRQRLREWQTKLDEFPSPHAP